MQDLAYPAHRELEQEFALLIALERAARTTTGPPPHARQFRGIVLLIERDQDDRQPMEPRHKNGAAWGAVVAFLDAHEPGGLTRTHRTILFCDDAFWLLPDTLIPHGQRLHPCLFPLLPALSGPFPEKQSDHFTGPFHTTQQLRYA